MQACPATGACFIAVLGPKPPTAKLVVLWQPSQAAVPVGILFVGGCLIVLNVRPPTPAQGPVPAPWQVAQPLVMPVCKVGRLYLE